MSTAIAPARPDTLDRHYRAGQLSLHLRVKEQWACVIGAEFARQQRDGKITRALLMRRMGDKTAWQFRRDISAITKIGTRNGCANALPGFNRLLSFASALGIPPSALSPANSDSCESTEQVAA